jgi:hypothetical protein
MGYQGDVTYDLSGMKVQETDGTLQSANSFGLVTIEDHDKKALSFVSQSCATILEQSTSYPGGCTLTLDNTDLSNSSSFRFVKASDGTAAGGTITRSSTSGTDYTLNTTTPAEQFVKIEATFHDLAGNIATEVLSNIYNLSVPNTAPT